MTIAPPKKRIAVVTAGFATGGGVPAVCDFILQTIRDDGEFEADVIDLATSLHDPCSRRLLKPGTWLRGLQTENRVREDGTPYMRVGANWAEWEPQRYRPRKLLDSILNRYDLIQFVCGIPAWAGVARRIDRPVFLQVATISIAERRSILSGPVPSWRQRYGRLILPTVARADDAGLRRPDLVFVENQPMANYAAKVRGGETGVVYSPPGVDTVFFSPGQEIAPATVLGVGRLGDARKNWPLLVRAFFALPPATLARSRLRLAGLGELPRALLDEIAASPHADRVEILRDVPRERLAEIFREAAVFALSSDEEGLGVVVLEAMASGLPVVATACGGPEGLVIPGTTGFLVPTGEVAPFSARLAELLDNSDARRAFGRAGRQRIEREFSLAVAGTRFIAEYRRALRGNAMAAPASRLALHPSPT